MSIRNNLLMVFQLILRKYKAAVFRPYLRFLSNSSFFFTMDAFIFKTFGPRYFTFYIHVLDPIPSDLTAKEVWEIVTYLGTVLRQWELERTILFPALDVLWSIMKKVAANELVLDNYYCAI